MKRMRVERERQGRSRAEVARVAGLTGTVYGWIESGRFLPYPVQLGRVAAALGWPVGHADELLREVGEDHGGN